MQRRAVIGLAAVVTAACLALQCGDDSGPGPGLSILPGGADLEVSESQQFIVDLEGQTPMVNWYVDGVRGGTPATGMIGKGGLYVAPSAVPPGGVVTVKAVVISDTTFQATAEARISKPAESVYVTVTPDTASVAADGQSAFSAAVFGCSSDEVTWSSARMWGSSSDLGWIAPNGVYHAPATPEASFALIIKATSAACTTKTGVAQMVVYVPLSTFTVELEHFTAINNIGGAGISSSQCGGASGSYQATGLDVTGEWIQVPIHVPVTGIYTASLRYQAPVDGLPIVVAASTADCGASPQEIGFSLTQGDGIG